MKKNAPILVYLLMLGFVLGFGVYYIADCIETDNTPGRFYYERMEQMRVQDSIANMMQYSVDTTAVSEGK